MKVYWYYRCDFGHRWMFFRDEDAEEQPEDTVCPEGHEAVTLQKRRLPDETIISLLPGPSAGHYHFLITRSDGTEERVSQKAYPWDEVIALAEKFRDYPFAHALLLWKKLKP